MAQDLVTLAGGAQAERAGQRLALVRSKHGGELAVALAELRIYALKVS